MKMKKLIVALTVTTLLGSTAVAFAATRPVDIVSKLTGRSVESLYQERLSGKTYGTIAKEAGKLEEFKAEMLKEKKAILDERVKAGILTQAQADEIYNAIKNNQATCDGIGNAKIGQKYGVGFGQGMGMGQGKGQGKGKGLRNGLGKGAGYGFGYRINQNTSK
ncbi:MAG: YckD family protein [Caloramator sp.]|nr:YckD family protein [Caloramator sp.]